ncbi:Os01g0834250, partial [Oryza sativa Japonica Group]
KSPALGFLSLFLRPPEGSPTAALAPPWPHPAPPAALCSPPFAKRRLDFDPPKPWPPLPAFRSPFGPHRAASPPGPRPGDRAAVDVRRLPP